MAENGILSAMGLTIENNFRDVPLTLASGTNYNIGNPVSNPHRFWTVQSGAGAQATTDIMVADDEIDGDVETTRTMKTGILYSANIPFYADGENLYYPLLGILGRDVQTQIQTASTLISTDMFRHEMTPSKSAPSFAMEELFGNHFLGRLSSGCTISRLELDFGKIVNARMTLEPHRQVPNEYRNAAGAKTKFTIGQVPTLIPKELQSTLGDGTNTWNATNTPIYVDVNQEQPNELCGTGPFTFADMVQGTATDIGGIALAGAPDYTNQRLSYISLGGVEYPTAEILEGLSLYIERSVTSQMIAGSGYDTGAVTGGGIKVGGKITTLFKDLLIQLTTIQHCRVAITLRFLGMKPGSGGSQQYMMEIHMPNVRFTNPEGPISNNGPITVGAEFRARKDPALGYGIKVTINNTVDNRKLGGQVYNGTAQIYGYVGTLSAVTVAGVPTATFTTPIFNIVKGDKHNFLNSTINGGAPVQMTVVSADYVTGIVTYSSNIGFAFPAGVGTIVTKATIGGLGGWSRA